MKKNSFVEHGEKVKCDVCGQIVLVDSFGNGKCENCGWVMSGSGLNQKFHVGYPNLVSLSKAKSLFEKGLPFVPDFDDFVLDLTFYGEMEFWIGQRKFVVVRYSDDGTVQFSEEDGSFEKTFDSVQDFAQNAKIDGEKLCDIWADVGNVWWLT